MIRLGMHASLWAADWTRAAAELAIPEAAKYGLEVLEFPLLAPETVDIEHSRDLFEEHGVEPAASLCLPMEATAPLRPKEAERFLMKALDVAHAVGCDFLGGVTYSALGWKSGKPPLEEEYANVVKATHGQTQGEVLGNGDASLAMYGAEITPNEHKLALQFGVLDNFYDSGEVSGDGHVWSTAGIGTDYLEKTWQQNYRGSQRTYDFEGVVAEGYPLLQKIPDVVGPASGYLWGNMDRHGKTHYNFGEYISSTFCDVKKSGSSQEGPLLEGWQCEQKAIRPTGFRPSIAAEQPKQTARQRTAPTPMHWHDLWTDRSGTD